VFVTPVDDAGDIIKAAGALTVEAFDLAGEQPVKLGTWTFDLPASRKLWSSVLNRFHYTLPCPWQGKTPAGERLHVEVTFVDELTQASFKKSVDVTVHPPTATAPASAPTSGK
jgi:hypothetical protein